MSGGACQHCGAEHPPGTGLCPRTGEAMSSPGAIGSRIDRYQVLSLLGTGGFGTVYRARHAHTDAVVALKVLKKQLNADQAMLDRFLREARAAAAVGSEHIVRVLDAGVAEGGTAFLALELLEGWDLKELATRESPLSAARIVELMAQTLEGLAAAHARGVVHRDIKPANIFVVKAADASGAERDFVKLLDFGISKIQGADGAPSGLTMTGMAMGTPAYMASEQFFDARNVDGRADVYSVAAVLYELLARRLPFEAQSYAELVVKVKTEVPPPLQSLAPQLPADLCAAVDRGLSRERDARWPQAREFAAALRRTQLGPGQTVPQPAQATPLPVPLSDTPSMMHGATRTPMPAAAPQATRPSLPSPGPASAQRDSPSPGPSQVARAQTVPPTTGSSAGPTPQARITLSTPSVGPTAPTPAPGWQAPLPTGQVAQPQPTQPKPSPAAAGKKGLPVWVWVIISAMVLGCCFCGAILSAGQGSPSGPANRQSTDQQ